MKKIIAFLIVLFCIVQVSHADPGDPADTTFVNKKVDAINNEIKALKNSVDATKKELIETLKSDSSKKECNCVPAKDGKVAGSGEWFIVLSPFYLLILVVSIVAIRLRNFKFTDALTENEPPKKIIKNPEYNAGAIAANASIPNLSILFPPTIEISNIQPSLIELKEILAAKEATVVATQASFKKAEENAPILKQAADAAQKELDTAEDETSKSEQAVKDVQAQLKILEGAAVPDADAIKAAQISLAAAQKVAEENAALVTSATIKVEIANNAVAANTNAIKTLPDLILQAKAEAENARNKFNTAEIEAKNSTTYSTSTYRPSISRYIAFITSLVTIILVVCMSSFFIYNYIRTGCPPDFGALTMVLIALGLGVTPYITNKISTAAAVNKP